MTDEQGERDVRRWLDSAVADEPPLTLDRDEVFRRGRRGLRNRRLFQTGGAMAGVVAVAAAAVVFGGWAGEDERTVPPAATSAPPTTPVTSAEPPPSSEVPPSAAGGTERGRHLTAVLPGLLPDDARLKPLSDREPTFMLVDGRSYELEADVRTPSSFGWLSVVVVPADAHSKDEVTCDALPDDQEFDQCVMRDHGGVALVQAVQKLGGGEVRNWVRAIRPDGVAVTVVSSNLSADKKAAGHTVTYDHDTVLSDAELVRIAVAPELAMR